MVNETQPTTGASNVNNLANVYPNAKTGTGWGIKLFAENDSSPGEIQIKGGIQGQLNPGVNNLASVITSIPYTLTSLTGLSKVKQIQGGNTVNIKFNYHVIPSSTNQQLNELQKILNARDKLATAVYGASPSSFSQNASNIIPSPSKLNRSIGRRLATEIGGNKITGKSPVMFDETWNVPTVTIPKIPSSKINNIRSKLSNFSNLSKFDITNAKKKITDINPIKVTITAVPSSSVQNIISNITQQYPSVTLDIPMSVFVKEKPISLSNCAQRFPDAASAINTAKSDVTKFRNRAQSDLKSLKNIKSTLSNADNTISSALANDVSIQNARQKLSNLSVSNISKLSQSEISSISKQFSQANITDINKSKIDSEVQKARNKYQTLSPKCMEQLSISSLNNEYNTFTNAYSEALKLYKKLQNIIPTISATKSKPRLSCADVSRKYKNKVNAFSSDVQSFVSSSRLNRTPQRFSKLVQRGNNIVSEITKNVNPKNPCKQQLQSQVKSSINQLKSVGSVSRSSLPCGERYKSLEKDVSSFETQVANARQNRNISDIKSAIQKGRNVMSKINSNTNPGGSCRTEYQNRVRSSIQSLQRSLNLLNNRGSLVSFNIPQKIKNANTKEVQKLKNQQGSASASIQNLQNQLNSLKNQINSNNS